MLYKVKPCWHTHTCYTIEADSLEEAQKQANQVEYDYCCQNNLYCSGVEVEVVDSPENFK